MGILLPWLSGARPIIAGTGKRTLIMGEDDQMRFQMLRAKYHALPAAAEVFDGRIEAAPVGCVDYVLVVKRPYAHPDQSAITPTAFADSIRSRSGRNVTPVWEQPNGFLLELSPPACRSNR